MAKITVFGWNRKPQKFQLKTNRNRMSQIDFGTIKLFLNLNLRSLQDVHMCQNFVLGLFELHRPARFHVRKCSIFELEKTETKIILPK